MAITKRQLTGGEKTGAGLYDELMRTSESHLKHEFKAGRIVGKEYTNAYMGMMQANLQTALQFVLSRELTNEQVKLAKDQLLQSNKQNELLELQKAQLELANQTAQYNLDITLPKQTEILTSQVTQAAKQIEVLTAQISQVNAQTELVGKQETLVDEQIKSEGTKTTNPTGGTAKAAYDKTMAEIDVLAQKKITEQKQTTGTHTDTGGLVGYEMNLKHTQKESFLRDAEQKASKIYSDIFSVMYSTEAEGMDNDAWGFSSSNSNATLNKLLNGVE
ncbi:virion structural protein [Vibrio phage 1.245.O._10N.261.54.C7]|uniref:Coil containing protein n=1 Tax=Vibrio phage 1.245.O._10N.261.54.C7 TaxID=1881236 RepID=A0A2I7RWC6_9CAUD|nr:virion structural protein [Vibrio phage 1.245.O._10N.261.54.C7]AUR97953.1 coil containing protein [Vibrio phage 1.245.O._10N.261.54.C7]